MGNGMTILAKWMQSCSKKMPFWGDFDAARTTPNLIDGMKCRILEMSSKQKGNVCNFEQKKTKKS